MLNLGSARDPSELTRRLAVTAAALVAFRAGSHIPLPGLDPHALAQLTDAPGALARISILGLGIAPFFAVLVLAEFAKVVAPRLRRWEAAEPRNRDRLVRILVLLAVVAAAAQALGIAVGLENVARLVGAPGVGFRLTCMVTLVAGAMASIWLADQITRHGLGGGVWLLLITPTLADVLYRVGAMAEWYSRGTLGGVALLLCGALFLLAVGAVVSLVRTGTGSSLVAPTCLWSTLLSYMALPWLLITLSGLAGDMGSIEAWFAPNRPAYFPALAALVCVFVALYVRSLRKAGIPAPLSAPPVAIAGTLIAVVLLADVLPADFRLLLPLQGQMLIVTAIIALALLERWWQPPIEPAARDAPRDDPA